MTDEDIQNCIDATDWCRADYEYFRGGGFSSHFRTKAEMPVTMLRVNIVEGIGPVIQIAEGYTCNLDDDIHDKLDNRTDPTWPTTWFAPILTGKGAFTDVSVSYTHLDVYKRQDWNDMLYKVCREGKGESLWTGMQFGTVLRMIAELAELKGEDKQKYLDIYESQKKLVNEKAWDGKWYIRCITDDGRYIGSEKEPQAKIWLNSQSWSVISGMGCLLYTSHLKPFTEILTDVIQCGTLYCLNLSIMKKI